MKSNATYTITLSKLNIPLADTQFLANFEFTLGIPTIYFITGIRCIASLFDLGSITYSYPKRLQGQKLGLALVLELMKIMI